MAGQCILEKYQFDIILDNLVDKLSSEGWTLPIQMTLGMTGQVSCTSDISDINAYLYSFFTSSNYSATKAMIKDIASSRINPQLKKVTNECWIAFQNRLYAVCAIALLTVIEGVLSDFNDDKRNIRMMKICKNQIAHYCHDGWVCVAYEIEKHVWISYREFIKNLYQKSDFGSDEPDIINRHWLLHGRSGFDITEIDCIRLFNAVSSLCMVVEKDAKLEKTEGECN